MRSYPYVYPVKQPKIPRVAQRWAAVCDQCQWQGIDHRTQTAAWLDVRVHYKLPHCSQCAKGQVLLVDDVYGREEPMCEDCYRKLNERRYMTEHYG